MAVGYLAQRFAWVRALALAAVLGLAACGSEPHSEPAARAAARGDAGVERELRVVSLAPSLTRIALALGAGQLLVGVDQFSHALPELHDVPSLGGLYTPDLERTVELAPDAVLAVDSAAQRAFLDVLRARGIAVQIVSAQSLEQVLASYEQVAVAIGRPGAGAALAERVRVELAAEQARVARLPRPRLALILEREPLYAIGGGSFASELLRMAGGENVFADLDAANPRVSLEALAERAPELLLETSDAPDDVAAYWSRFRWLRRSAAVPRDGVTLPGPQLVAAVIALRARIHPELAAPAEGSAAVPPAAAAREGDPPPRVPFPSEDSTGGEPERGPTER